MEDNKEAITEIKTGFASLLDAIKGLGKPKMQFGEMMTSDGKMMTYEGDLSEGVAVMIDGAPAPDGSYTLEDGTVCDVAGGVITKITAAASDSAEYEQKFAAMEEKYTALEAKFEAATNANTEQFNKLTETLTKMTDLLGKQGELIGQFSEQTPPPASQPTNRLHKRMDKEAAIGKQIEEILKLKNNA